MKKLIPGLFLCTLAASGCATVGEKTTPKAKAETEVSQAQGQLQSFVKIIEHINQATSADGAANPADTEKLNEIITRLEGPLKTMESSANESEKVRQMLSAADDMSGNRRNLFSGLFDLFAEMVSNQSK